MTKKITTLRLGLLGCGVVGTGVIAALQKQGSEIQRRFGIHLVLVRVAVRDLQRPRAPFVDSSLLVADWQQVCQAENVDCVIEAMGGRHAAKEAVQTALALGKSVVTANKELLAFHQQELEELARSKGTFLACESSVMAGVPVLYMLDTYFQANRVTRLAGIVNGTCNYILSQMSEFEQEFHPALAQAQRHGFAEADPSSDIEGRDALYKLAVLVRHAWQHTLTVDLGLATGINGLSQEDLRLAERFGCRIKHVVEAVPEGIGDSVSVYVGPQLLPLSHPLAQVAGANNALAVSGNLVGDVIFSGPGAGAGTTASGILEDVLRCALHTSPSPVAMGMRGPGTAAGLSQSGTLTAGRLTRTGRTLDHKKQPEHPQTLTQFVHHQTLLVRWQKSPEVGTFVASDSQGLQMDRLTWAWEAETVLSVPMDENNQEMRVWLIFHPQHSVTKGLQRLLEGDDGAQTRAQTGAIPSEQWAVFPFVDGFVPNLERGYGVLEEWVGDGVLTGTSVK
ncbi:homoserine dehydrogenase [Alicyclobacillaceae bacterium I2511]|nr:homoserine dehydrogenase [Alicyclobacillaceae bacterium I2511]